MGRETRMKSKISVFFLVVLLIVITIFIHIEIQPHAVISSSVYQDSEQTEIHLYVLANTFFCVDKNKVSEEIICGHQKINGIQNNTVYTLRLYRTLFHYRRNWEYDTIICDEKGAIICCGEDLGV